MSLLQKYYDLRTIQKVGLLITVASLGTLIAGIIGFSVISSLSNDLKSMNDETLMSVKELKELEANFHKLKSDIMDGIMDKPMRQMRAENIVKIIEEMKSGFEKYSKRNLDEQEKSMFDEMNKDLSNFYASTKNISDLLKSDNIQVAENKYFQIEIKFDELTSDIQKLAAYNIKEAEKTNKENEQHAVNAKIGIIFAIIIPIFISIWFGCFISFRIQGLLDKLVSKMNEVTKGNLKVDKFGYVSKSDVGVLCTSFDIMLENLRSLVSEVITSAEEISANSEEMSASSEQTAQGAQQTANSTTQLAQGAQEVSRNIEQGAANVNKMNKAVQGVSEEAKVVAQLGNDTETNANVGAEHVKKAVAKIESIKKVSEDISVNISELGKLSSEIEQIVDLIKNIAGQTNLLALNAAIEAARAGEHGKGFAVVADEVKKLAGQSAGATEKITAMIKEIQNKTNIAVTTMGKATTEVEEGVLVVNDAGKALENIITQVKAANGKIQGITREIDGVAKTSEDMVKMIENISAVTEETAASAEEISSITEEQTASLEEISASAQTLAAVAETLTKQVSVFKI